MDWRQVFQENGVSGVEHFKPLRVSVTGDTVLSRFASPTFPDASLENSVRTALSAMFPQAKNIRLALCCPALLNDFRQKPQDYAKLVFGRFEADMPGIAPLVKDCVWQVQGDELVMTFASANAERYMIDHDAVALVRATLKALFGVDFSVSTASPADAEHQLAAMAERQAKRDEVAIVNAPQVKEKAKACAADAVVYGKRIAGDTVPVAELIGEGERVILEGRVIKTDLKETRKGDKKILLFDLTDYTSTVTCKLFLPAEKEREIEPVKEGAYLKVRGVCMTDTFTRDFSVMLNDINIAAPEIHTDDEPVKRIELHAHTKMSNMDAVVSAEDLVKRAMSLGHKAIGITDHGVLQAFPEALAAAGKSDFKVLMGVEGYLFDEEAGIALHADARSTSARVVVLDIETTGLSPHADKITEIAAVRVENGEITGTFQTFVNPERPIPARITELTGITDEMVRDAPLELDALARFLAFAEGDALLAHNASFDLGFLRRVAKQASQTLPQTVIDSLALSRALLPALASHKLNIVCTALGVKLLKHHRALDDATATGKAWIRLAKLAADQGAKTLSDLNTLSSAGQKKAKTHHIIIYAATQKGLTNLNRLVSESHLNYFHRHPRMPRSRIAALREGLVIGSACEAGELFQAIYRGEDEKTLIEMARFYDYLEIQPIGNNAFMVREGMVKNDDALREINRRIVELGALVGRPVCATCDVHFLNPRDAVFREILMKGMGFPDAASQPPLHMRTTREMLDEFAYLGEEAARAVVIDNPLNLLERFEKITLFPKHPEGKPTFQPTLPNAAEFVERGAWERAKELYGDPLPEIVRARLEQELSSIIGNGFATLYRSGELLVKKSLEDGYLVGSRGSIGGSMVATMLGITEVNPLRAHYLCPSCTYSDFSDDPNVYTCGVDLPEKNCPKCGTPLGREGFETAFEVFLGFYGDKVPDIDLNFSGEYQAKAHAFTEEMFGKGKVYRAGTIGTLAEKTAFGYVNKWLEEIGKRVTNAERDRLILGCTGVKRSTGQHPGGMVIVPADRDIYEFCAVQHPADDAEGGVVTTHIDFNSLHDLLVKLDILGHDDPTMLHRLEHLTGIKAGDRPISDPGVLRLFIDTSSLGTSLEGINCKSGTLGIPEFGTRFVRGMLEETKPSSVGELIRISGLSHGENVWLGNAQDLIQSNTATLRECICAREDILKALIFWGIEKKTAFDIMEYVRKNKFGKPLKPEHEAALAACKNVPPWFIDSLRIVRYLYPRAHATAYVMSALRIAWYKVYQPLAYYAAYFSIRADGFDAERCLKDSDAVAAAIRAIDPHAPETTQKEKDARDVLELVYEMLARGFSFLPVDLYKSHHTDFLIVGDALLPPLGCLPGVGETAARSIYEQALAREFISREELRKRAKVSTAVAETLARFGCLAGLPESNQITMFDLMDDQEPEARR